MKSIFNLTYLFIVFIFGNNLYSQDLKKLKKEELINYINNRNSNIDSLNAKLIELGIQRDRLDGELKKLQINFIDSRNAYESQLKELDFDLVLRLNRISRLEESIQTYRDSLKEIRPYIFYPSDLSKPQFGGTYSIGCGEAGRILKIYPVSNVVLLFALDMFTGPPSYNQGQAWGKIMLNGNIGHYIEGDCEIKFLFGPYWVIVDVIRDNCAYGGRLAPDGAYPKIDFAIPNKYNDGGAERDFKDLWFDLNLPNSQ